VVVVEEVTGGGATVVCSVVVVLVTLSEPPHPATRMVLIKSRAEVKNRRNDVLLVMA
jgi:hypothetical protein